MLNSIRLKCYKCEKRFKVHLRLIEYLQINRCPNCGHVLTYREKVELYHAAYYHLKKAPHRYV